MPRSKSTNGNTHFTAFGPFELPFEIAGRGGKTIDRKGIKKKLELVAQQEYPEQPQVWRKSGLYIFAIRRPGGSTAPYYVGMTRDQALLDEALENHKLRIYNEVLANVSGKPILFIIAPTDAGKKAANRALLEQIEDLLIARLYEMNEDMRNKRGKPSKRFVIDGVPLIASQGGMRRGRRSRAAAEVCKLIRSSE
jgi:hypothetical protein